MRMMNLTGQQHEDSVEGRIENFKDALRLLSEYGPVRLVFEGKVLPLDFDSITADEAQRTVNIGLKLQGDAVGAVDLQSTVNRMELPRFVPVTTDSDPFSLY